MFKDCTFNININLPENQEEENTQHFLYDEYDDCGRNEIESLINKLNLVEGMDYYWGKNETQDVWELWVLPDNFGKIYHKTHSPVEVKEPINKKLVGSLVFNFNNSHHEFKNQIGQFIYDLIFEDNHNDVQLEYEVEKQILTAYVPTTETDTEKTNIFENKFSPRIIKGKFLSSFEYTRQSGIPLLNMESPSMWLVERTYDDVVSIYEALGFIAQKAPYHES